MPALAKHDPLLAQAGADAINARRAELERLPVKRGADWFDFDLTSRARFEGSIFAWQALLDADDGTLFTPGGEIKWRTATNGTLTFNQADFVLLYNDLTRLAAVRASALYVKSLQLKAANASQRDCLPEHWGIELP